MSNESYNREDLERIRKGSAAIECIATAIETLSRMVMLFGDQELFNSDHIDRVADELMEIEDMMHTSLSNRYGDLFDLTFTDSMGEALLSEVGETDSNTSERYDEERRKSLAELLGEELSDDLDS